MLFNSTILVQYVKELSPVLLFAWCITTQFRVPDLDHLTADPHCLPLVQVYHSCG